MTRAEMLARYLDDEGETVHAEIVRRLAAALMDLAGPKREHYECDDGWYSCPKHPSYFGYDDREHCSCGADEHNEKLERHADALRDVKEQA